jgi:DNA topoisomerase IB
MPIAVLASTAKDFRTWAGTKLAAEWSGQPLASTMVP